MVKKLESMKIQNTAREHLLKVLKLIPALQIQKSKTSTELKIKHGSQQWVLPFKTISNASPANVRSLAAQFKLEFQDLNNAYLILLAPWFSRTSQDILEQAGLGFIDDYGNVQLKFGTVFIRFNSSTTPPPETRALRSLFTPAASRVLHCLMAQPYRTWRLLELSQLAKVSLGQVHKVIRGLLEREWAAQYGTGRALDLRLSNPQALLQDWKNQYQPSGVRQGFYTLLHGEQLQQALQKVFDNLEPDEQLAFAGLSAASYIAPYTRTNTIQMYANHAALEKLKIILELQTVSRGENLIVQLEPDNSVFQHAIRVQHIVCTSAVQTYLDLYQNGERGREAAEFLHTHVIQAAWNL